MCILNILLAIQTIVLILIALHYFYFMKQKQSGEKTTDYTTERHNMPQNRVKIGQKKHTPYIGNFHETPEYMRDDKLHSGYRINFHSYRQVFKSLFQVHNQTVNIWTHFGGTIILLCIVLSAVNYQLNHSNTQNQFINLIQKIKLQNSQCHVEAVQIVQQSLIPMQVKEKLKKKICHPHGKQYFGDFVCQIAADEINLIKNYVLSNFGENMKKIQRMKLHWEQEVIPSIVNEIQKQSNFSAFNFIKQKIQEIQLKMDEKNYQYLEFGQHGQNPQNMSRFPLIIYLFCGIICLGCSSAFHLFNAMSSRAYKISIGLDYAGINVFISGSVFPAFYYGMYCYFDVAYFYMAIIMAIGSTLFALSVTQWFRKPQQFVLKSICYFGFSFFLTIPISHLVINEVFFDNYGDDFSFLPSLHWYILGAISFIVGIVVFTKRCPDRHSSGKYDVCGHSHQIWHSLVLLGMFFLYFGACTNYETRKESSCPANL